MKRDIFLIITLLAILATGCGIGPQVPAPSSADMPLFRPVTQAPPATPTPLPTQPARATTLPTCSDNLKFISDATIPDGTVVTANSSLDKRWAVENTGTCNWDERYHLRLTGGPEMGANPIQALFPARAGSQAVIRIQMTAPEKAGAYRSAWQAYNPADEAFGEVIYIDVVVK